MQASPAPRISTWFQDEIEEEGMFEDHAYLWQHMIQAMPEKDLTRFHVLDYGCNRGGFLQTLFRQRPFKQALGVDIAEVSLAIARKRNAHIPAEFILPAQLEHHKNSIDIAFSHEVLYLLPNLDDHAAAIAHVLKKDAVYYAAIGCHTGNPLWQRWRELITQSTTLPVFDYSLDDYAASFRRAGMRIEMRSFQLQDFILIKPDNPYFPTAADSLDYHTRVKTIIRATKEG